MRSTVAPSQERNRDCVWAVLEQRDLKKVSFGKALEQYFLRAAAAILVIGASTGAAADKASWKEEVLLHDGRKLIVERSQTRGGRHEIGQEVPIAEHTISFSFPGIRSPIIWKSGYGTEITKSSLQLLALDIVKGVPYIVAHATGCIAYNKWDRPNPPYVFFKYDGKAWQRVTLAEFPAEIQKANVVIGTQMFEKQLTGNAQAVPADRINAINAEAKDPAVLYLRTFVREPIQVAQTSDCPEMIYDGNGGWLSMDWFSSRKSLEACMKVCGQRRIDIQYCPCRTLFKRNE